MTRGTLDFVSLSHEFRLVPFTYEYPRPAVTADVVLFTLQGADLAVLLIRRARAPFKGAWALPGGFVDKDEPLERAAARELAEETGVTGIVLEQLAAFGDPGRDPRGHTVSVAFFSFVAAERHLVRAGDDASEAAWVPLTKLTASAPRSTRKRSSRRTNDDYALAFDHAAVIQLARRRLQERLVDPRRPAQFELVPLQFTLTELQHVHEAILGQPLDKRNFRARLLASKVVQEVGRRRMGRHRPAQLYRFRQEG